MTPTPPLSRAWSSPCPAEPCSSTPRHLLRPVNSAGYRNVCHDGRAESFWRRRGRRDVAPPHVRGPDVHVARAIARARRVEVLGPEVQIRERVGWRAVGREREKRLNLHEDDVEEGDFRGRRRRRVPTDSRPGRRPEPVSAPADASRARVTSAPVAPPPLGAFVRVRPLVFVSPSRAAARLHRRARFRRAEKVRFRLFRDRRLAPSSLPEGCAARAYSFGGAPCVATWCSSRSRNILSAHVVRHGRPRQRARGFPRERSATRRSRCPRGAGAAGPPRPACSP